MSTKFSAKIIDYDCSESNEKNQSWWQKNPMKPRQRVERCVKHRGLETLKIYDKILKETGRKNIG